jgi:effector-binding domain-containing protein
MARPRRAGLSQEEIAADPIDTVPPGELSWRTGLLFIPRELDDPGVPMAYEIRVEPVESRPIASVRRRATIPQLSTVVPSACGEVWNFIRAAGIEHPGRNLAIYRDGGEGQLDVEIGVEVADSFTGDGTVSCSATPAGTVATTAHFGPYDSLGEAHKAVVEWCRDHHRDPTGMNWEIYGHWEDDPEKLRTDVFYLLEA